MTFCPTKVQRFTATKVEKADHERLAVRRIDVVDENGVIRMILASSTPPQIVDGIHYKRTFPVSGITLLTATATSVVATASPTLKERQP